MDFDPSKPFTVVSESTSFDPDQPFSVVSDDAGYNIVGGVKDVGKMLYDIPVQTKGAIGSLFEDDDPYERETFADRWQQEAKARTGQRRNEVAPEDRSSKIIPLPGFLSENGALTRGDVQDAGASTGFSAVAMGGGLSGGLIGSAIGPWGTAGGALSGAGAAAYQMDKANITRQLLDTTEQAIQRKLTDDERAELLARTESVRSDHALWEAGPEAIGTALSLTGIGKIFGGAASGVTKKVIGGVLTTFGGELSTETVTQIGQNIAENEMGLGNGDPMSFSDPASYGQALKEVAPSTIALTGVTGGGGYIAGKGYGLINGARQEPVKVEPPPSVTQASTVDEAIAAASAEVEAPPIVDIPIKDVPTPAPSNVQPDLPIDEKLKRDLEAFDKAANESGWNDPEKQRAAQERIDANIAAQRAKRPASRTELAQEVPINVNPVTGEITQQEATNDQTEGKQYLEAQQTEENNGAGYREPQPQQVLPQGNEGATVGDFAEDFGRIDEAQDGAADARQVTETVPGRTPSTPPAPNTNLDASIDGRAGSAVLDSGIGNGELNGQVRKTEEVNNDINQQAQAPRVETATDEQRADESLSAKPSAAPGGESVSTRNIPITEIKATHGRQIGNWIASQRNAGNADVTVNDAREALGLSANTGEVSNKIKEQSQDVNKVSFAKPIANDEQSAPPSDTEKGADGRGGESGVNREKDENLRQLLTDHIATRKSQGLPPKQEHLNKLAEVEDRLAGKQESSDEYISSNKIFGHPEATSMMPNIYGNLVPIKIRKGENVDRWIDKAQKEVDALQKKIGTAEAVAKKQIKSNPKGITQAKRYLSSAEHTEDQSILESLREETLPELSRLNKQLASQQRDTNPVVSQETENVRQNQPTVSTKGAEPASMEAPAKSSQTATTSQQVETDESAKAPANTANIAVEKALRTALNGLAKEGVAAPGLSSNRAQATTKTANAAFRARRIDSLIEEARVSARELLKNGADPGPLPDRVADVVNYNSKGEYEPINNVSSQHNADELPTLATNIRGYKDKAANITSTEAPAKRPPKKSEQSTDKENLSVQSDVPSAEAQTRVDGVKLSVSPSQAKSTNVKVSLPDDEIFKNAVDNTESAKITRDGLLIDVVRFQNESQGGELSIRTGVFYLPANSPDVKHYRGGKNGYGGTTKEAGTTLIRNPLFVKGATGGKAPEAAYDFVKGKGAYDKMRSDVLSVVLKYGKRASEEDVYNILEKYGADGNIAYEILSNSQKGNTLAYAIQENIVAHSVRGAGHDAVVGYSKRRDGSYFISEIFDVRETTYPLSGQESEIHPDFFGKRKKTAKKSESPPPAQSATISELTPAQRATLTRLQRNGKVKVVSAVEAEKILRDAGASKNSERLSDTDREYLDLAKYPEKNAEKLQKMVDDAANKAGYNADEPVFHTGPEDFNVFRRRYERDGVSSAAEAAKIVRFGKGIFFSSDASVSERFGSVTKKFYLKIDSPIEVNLGGASYFDGTLHDPETGEEYLDDDGNVMRVPTEYLPDEMAETHLDDSGKYNTGVIVRGVYEKIPSKGKPQPMADTYVVGNPSQIKSADPVTKDVSGNVIPLSQRFNDKSEDTRYSKDGKVQGFTLPDGTAYIVPENIASTKLWPVLRHEIGIHIGKALQSDKAFQRLLTSIESRKDENTATGKAIREAVNRIPERTGLSEGEEYDTLSPARKTEVDTLRREETLAYLTEGSPQVGIVRQFIAMVKRALIRLGVNPAILKVEDLAAIADSAIRREAKAAPNQGTPSALMKSTTPSNLSKWLGSSVVDKVVYHGSETFGKSDNFTFDPDRPNATAKTKSPGAGLGTFFTEDRNESMGYAGVEGEVFPMRLRIENPLEINSYDLPNFQNRGEALAFRKRKMLQGYDGIHLKDLDHWIIFEPGQAKSADRNNGEYSRKSYDVRYSIGQALDKQDVPDVIPFVIKTAQKPDIGAFLKNFSSPEFYMKKFPAAWNILQTQLNRMRDKFEKENEILGDFSTFMKDAQKEPESYGEASTHLLDKDKPGAKWYGLRSQEVYVATLDGEQVAVAESRSELDKLVSPLAKESGRSRGDYKVYLADEWTVKGPDGKPMSSHMKESEAVTALMDAEDAALEKAGMSDKARAIIRRFREMTNAAFDNMIADLRQIQEQYRALEAKEPVVDIDRPWKVMKNGRVAGQFASEADALAAVKLHEAAAKAAGKKAEKLSVEERAGDKTSISLSELIAEMNSLRGRYFPRQRPPGGVNLRAYKGDKKILEKFDFYIIGNKHIDAETGEVLRSAPSQLLSKLASLTNSASGYLPFIPTLEKRARELQKQGYKIVIEKDNSMPEAVFDVAHLTSSLDAMMREATKNVKGKAGEEAMVAETQKLLAAYLADIIKQRGYLASRMMRSEEYWEGFETDPLLAGVQYAKGISAGIAKRDAAQKMFAYFSGRDVTWKEWKEKNPEGTWDQYDELVESKRLDPKQQPNLYKEGLEFMQEALRNDEQIDRVIGTLKGLAVVKFLGFRISSAAVNLTNMLMAVPATISSMSGGGITMALRSVTSAAKSYTQYRTSSGSLSEDDRAIFLEISSRGWDEAQFNYENASVLMSKAGRGYAKFVEAAMFMFGAAEKANRATTIFAAYKEVRRNTSLNREDALQKAKDISDRAHGVYTKVTVPPWVRTMPVARLVYTFQKFSHNFMLNMTEMGMRGNYKEMGYMMLSPIIFGGIEASIATTLIAAIASAFGIDEPEEEFYRWAEKTFGSDMLFRQGVPGAVAGINMKSSIEIQNPFPKNMKELAGAPGAVVFDLFKGFGLASEGEFLKAGEALLPTAFGGMVKAVREGSEGVSTGNYGQVFYGKEPLKAEPLDQVKRFFTFNPSRLSSIREKQWREEKVKDKFQERRSDINSKLKRYYIFGKGDYADIAKEIQRYNEIVVGTGRRDIPRITGKSIRMMLNRARRPSKTERMREL